MCVCIHVCVYTQKITLIYMYIHTYTYLNRHTYVHTHSFWFDGLVQGLKVIILIYSWHNISLGSYNIPYDVALFSLCISS